MTTLLLAFVLLSLVITVMAIGVILGRKPIAGSCGGIGAALGEKDYTCDICGDDPKKCEQLSQSEANPLPKIDSSSGLNNASALFEDASIKTNKPD